MMSNVLRSSSTSKQRPTAWTHLQLDDGETFYYKSSGLLARLIPGSEHPVVTKPYRSRKVSPRITHIAWGQMKIEGVPAGRDFKVYPGGARPWDWKESNTHHVPGIQPQDVQELLDKGLEIIILSQGMQLALHTSQEAHQLISRHGWRRLSGSWRPGQLHWEGLRHQGAL